MPSTRLLIGYLRGSSARRPAHRKGFIISIATFDSQDIMPRRGGSRFGSGFSRWLRVIITLGVFTLVAGLAAPLVMEGTTSSCLAVAALRRPISRLQEKARARSAQNVARRLYPDLPLFAGCALIYWFGSG